MRDAPSNTDDIIDSRDVIARIEELEGERQELDCALATAKEGEYSTPEDGLEALEAAQADLESWAEDYGPELKALQALAEEGEGSPDWKYGETLIRDSYFKTYAKEMADDCGMLDEKVSSQWPYTCIDWEQAARELKYDYFSVDFDGVDYWVRA